MSASGSVAASPFGQAVLDRIRATRLEVGANREFVFNDPNVVWLVDAGYLDIFATTIDRSGKSGRRHYFGRVPEGRVAFGMAPQSRAVDEEEWVGLIAVPGLGTVVQRGDRNALVQGQFDLDIVVWVDDWITLVSEALANGIPVPRSAELLDAEPEILVSEGAVVTAQHLDIIWMSVAEGTCEVLENAAVRLDPGSKPFPLTERTWAVANSGNRLSCVYTPTLLAQDTITEALDSFHSTLPALIGAVIDGDSNRTRTIERSMASQRSTSRALFALGNTLRPATEYRTPSAGADTPLQRICEILGNRSGQTMKMPAAPPDSAHIEVHCRAIARVSGLGLRRITLSGDWWSRDGPPLVGRWAHDDSPVALLPGPNGYMACVGNDAELRQINRAMAEDLSSESFQFYRSLPATIESAKTALRFAARGLARDVKTVVAMGILSGLAAILTPIAMGELLAAVIPRGDAPMWIAILLALIMGALGSAMFDIVRAFALLRIESRMDESLQAAIWARLLSLPVPFFRRYTAGDLADRANGISAIRQFLTSATASGVLGVIFSIFSYALLFWYSWELALCATGTLIVLMLLTLMLANGQMRHQSEQFRVQGEIDGIVFQLIMGLGKIRLANAEGHAFERWAERFAVQKHHALSARRWNAGLLTVNSMFQPAAALILFAFIYYHLIEDVEPPSFDLADFLSFNAAFGQLVGALSGMTSSVTAIVAAMPLFDRLQPILDAQPEKTSDAFDPGEISGGVEVSNVSFIYSPGQPPAIDNVSFRIRPGEYVAFVGASGSGKSTLYRLILGFERPNSGAVFIDGQDLSSLDPATYRSQIGVVLQNGRLIAGSILENITGTLPLSLDDAWAAAQAAGLEDDIRDMPMGMHTVLPEGGVGISGGQKQRLLIARAIARRPRLFMLDEATSALDNRTQAIVQESLKRLKATRIVIAHRLSTIRDVDRIYVMERGRIIESGRPRDLMRADGHFAALAKRQIV